MARVDTPISYINLAAPLEIRPTRGKSRVERDGKRNSTALLLSSSFPVNSIRPNIFPLLRNGRGSRSQGSRATMSPSSESFFYFSLLLWKVFPSPSFSLKMFLLDLTLRRRDRSNFRIGMEFRSRKGCVGFSRFSGNLVESGGGGFVLGGR